MASYCAIGCYYILGLPLSCIFGFLLNLGVFGLQAGFTVAVAIQSMSYAIIIAKTDWQKVTDDAVERIEKENAELTEKVTINDSAANDSSEHYTKVL